MQALCDSHIFVNEMTPKEFFRVAYMWKFSRDITDTALYEDVKAFDEAGKVPAYATAYLINVYGAN